MENLKDGMQAMNSSMQVVDDRLKQLTDMLCTMAANQTKFPNQYLKMLYEREGTNPRRSSNREVRLEFSHFEGENPTWWVFKATQYFDFH